MFVFELITYEVQDGLMSIFILILCGSDLPRIFLVGCAKSSLITSGLRQEVSESAQWAFDTYC